MTKITYTNIGTGDFIYSFAIIADTHVGGADDGWDYGYRGWDDYLTSLPYGIGEPAERLECAVNKINSLIESEKIRFVVHLGDMTDSGELSEHGITISILNKLSVPWIPVIGNHDIWPYCNDKAQNPRFRLNDHVSSVRFVNRSPNPFENGVYLYEHANFSGKEEFFIGDVPDLEGSFIGNDKASSVKAKGGCWVTLYSDANYNGYYMNVKETSNLDMNDKISSIKIIPKDSNPSVTVYKDANFKGEFEKYTSSVNNVPKKNGRDWISSAKLRDCEAIFYVDADFKGYYMYAVGDISNFDMGGGLHPGVSSLRVHNCNTKGIYLYQDANYKGKFSLFCVDCTDLEGTHIGNDEASSIRIVNGAVVALYSDKNFKGSYTLFKENDPDFNKRLEAKETDPPDIHFYKLYKPYVEKLKNFGFANLEIAPAPVWNPEVKRNSYFLNYAFDYCDVHFIVLDFNPRSRAPLGAPGIGFTSNLHNFPGGTYQWFSQHLSKVNKPTIIFAHHLLTLSMQFSGFAPPSFSQAEYALLIALLYPYRKHLLGWFGGHGHNDWEEWEDMVIKVIETDACKDVDGGCVRIVKIHSNFKTEFDKQPSYPKKYNRIINDPKILRGKPVIKGTRISVELIQNLAKNLGWSAERILKEYPQLSREDVLAALEYVLEK
ncbi:MAG: beta/gamma crystallin-related protein [Nitrososphaerota archaeon]